MAFFSFCHKMQSQQLQSTIKIPKNILELKKYSHSQSIHSYLGFCEPSQPKYWVLKNKKKKLSSGVSSLGSSVDTWNDPVADSSAVLIPCQAVLSPALAHVSGISVHEQDDEVDHVVPGQQVAEACARGLEDKNVFYVICFSHFITLLSRCKSSYSPPHYPPHKQ